LNSFPTFARSRFRTSGFFEVERHENTVWVEHIISEGWALLESLVLVKCMRGPKILPGACLKAQAHHPSRSSARNDMAQHSAARSPSPHGLSGMHRFHLSVVGRKPFQRPDSHEVFAIPYRPQTDIGRLQLEEIQSVRTSGAGFRSGGKQMGLQ